MANWKRYWKNITNESNIGLNFYESNRGGIIWYVENHEFKSNPNRKWYIFLHYMKCRANVLVSIVTWSKLFWKKPQFVMLAAQRIQKLLVKLLCHKYPHIFKQLHPTEVNTSRSEFKYEYALMHLSKCRILPHNICTQKKFFRFISQSECVSYKSLNWVLNLFECFSRRFFFGFWFTFIISYFVILSTKNDYVVLLKIAYSILYL